MTTQQPTQTFSPHETALLVGVAVHNIRRWGEYHAAYLSAGATPPAGQLKRYTGRDVEVLKHVKALRDQGLPVPVINEQLKGLTFAEVDSNPNSKLDSAVTVNEIIDHPAAQVGPGAALPPVAVGYDLETLVEALERSRAKDSAIVRSGLTMFGLGFMAACLLFLVLVVLISIYR